MKLRSKIVLLLGITWLATSCIVYFGFRTSLENSYLALEKKEMIQDLIRSEAAITRMLISLQGSTADWANWDDSYKFMADKNATFIQSNMANSSFESTGADFILFFDTQGKYFYGGAYDHEKHTQIPVSMDVIKFIYTQKQLLNSQDGLHSKHTGVFKIDNTFALISSLPITTSKVTGPIHGHLVMGYFLDEPHLAILADVVQLSLKILPMTTNLENLLSGDVISKLQSGDKYVVIPKSYDTVYGYTYLKNINNMPIGVIQIENNRALYIEGLRSINEYLIVSISVGIMILVFLWYSLEIFLLERLLSLNKQITEIGATSKFSNRLKSSGNDEISSIIIAINNMLEIIELTQAQLNHRLSQRSDELEKLSKLNQNLVNEVDRHINVESHLKNQEQVLRHQVYHDPVTHLPNRIYFYEYLAKIVQCAEQENSTFAILFVDVDNFKSINDTFGHEAGDKYLKFVSEKLKSNIHEQDLAARLAGDEFIIYLENITDIDTTLNNLLLSCAQPMIYNNYVIQTTVSIGVCFYPQEASTLGDLQNHSDLAMYCAKRRGGNSYFFYRDVSESEFHVT